MTMKCPKCKSGNPGTATFCADCGTQLPSLEDIEVTETLETPKEELTTGFTFAGRYQIIEELGKGGMGRVYKVLDKEVNAKVALFEISPVFYTYFLGWRPQFYSALSGSQFYLASRCYKRRCA